MSRKVEKRDVPEYRRSRFWLLLRKKRAEEPGE
jgi:hypothetical protein